MMISGQKALPSRRILRPRPRGSVGVPYSALHRFAHADTLISETARSVDVFRTCFGSKPLRCITLAGIALILSQCTTSESAVRTSASPDQPWSPEGDASSDFSVHRDIADVETAAPVTPGGALGLPELIDLGQRSNPATRVAWQEAKQAAAGVGIIEGTFLPVITANVVGGVQDIVTPLPTLTGGTDYVSTTSRAVVPNLTLAWLIFDFGERQALKEAAEEIALAANVRFNATHQALIYNITRAYYLHGAAQSHLDIARQTRMNSLELQEAAEERFRSGLGTSLETAQAKQLVAQSKFRLVMAEDRLNDAYQDLLGAVGVAPSSDIRVKTATTRRLPRAQAVAGDRLIREALARRPDVLAAYSAVKTSESNQRAVEASFSPKIYLGAVAAANSGRIQTGSLPGLGVQGAGTGVFLGLSLPLYDGQIRENRLRQAEAATEVASATYEQITNAASREIILANTALRSALAAYEAASELRNAAQTSYDATFEAYRNGLGTLTAVSVADSALLDAREAQADAHATALIAAATLAFVLGNMTSRDAPAQAIR